MSSLPRSSRLRLQILGPLRVWRDGVEVAPGPRQQAHLLALLLARQGQQTSIGDLIEMTWGQDPPASALNVVHKYVGSLRRLLEPRLPPREAGSYLLRRGNGYVCAAGPDVFDLARFRELVGEAAVALSAQDYDAAHRHQVEALGLWAGPAGADVTQGPESMSIFAGLNQELFAACVGAAELSVSLGRPGSVLSPLHLAASLAPLHEPVQASLMVALAAAGHQAEALSVFGTVRSRLADELGIDPGPALQGALQRVLSQTVTPQAAQATARVPARVAREAAPPVTEEVTPTPGFIGRAEELRILGSAVAPVFDGGSAIVLIDGEPGAGKTRILEEVAAGAGRCGAVVLWGHCLEGDGAPSMWPWVEVARRLLDSLSTEAREPWLAGEVGSLVGHHDDDLLAGPAISDSNRQFRLFDDVTGLMGTVSSRGPVILILDDLQWADATSLKLFEHVAGRLPGGAVLAGAFRNRGPEPTRLLARTLAAASRLRGHRRVPLGRLAPVEVGELVRRETGRDVTSDAAQALHLRTAGNPFFVRELARVLAAGSEVTEEEVLSSGVPLTVRDVVRDRLAGLDADAQRLLEVAALVGRSVELAVLARAASLDMESCLERLEPARSLGLVGPTPGDPFSYRFTHDLVRQAVSEAIPPGRAVALHGRIADAIEVVGLSDESVAERVAHHLWASGPLADPARTVTALVRAGARAKAKTALGAAERQLGSAVELARRSSLLELELAALSQLIAVVGMRSMYGRGSVSLLERAEEVARSLGREREAAGFLFSQWTAHCQGLELDSSGPLARRLLDQGTGSSDPVVRIYGEAAWGIHQWHLGNVGESFRRLSAMITEVQADREPDPDPVRDGLQLLTAGMFAEISAYHGDSEQARTLHDRLELAAGDDPYAVTVATTTAARTAAVVGDPGWALLCSERGIAVDPHFSFVFLGTYLRLARCWARAVSAHDPESAADEAERLILANLSNPTRSCVATWYALLAEMRIAAGSLGAAAAALDRADECLERYGQRSAEDLVVLVRAQLARATGDSQAAVRLAEQARADALHRGAHLFVQRADRLLTDLGAKAGGEPSRPPGLHSSSTVPS
jgi:DNA-binding SARP family transcriptional activator